MTLFDEFVDCFSDGIFKIVGFYTRVDMQIEIIKASVKDFINDLVEVINYKIKELITGFFRELTA